MGQKSWRKTYVGDVAVQARANIHLAHCDEKKTAFLDIAKVAGPELQVCDLRDLDGLEGD